MGLDSDFHEMFQVQDQPPVVAKKRRTVQNDRQRLRAAARGRENRIRLEQLQMQHLNVLLRGADRPEKQNQPAKLKTVREDSKNSATSGPALLELNCNPSNFSVFAAVRQSVLEQKIRKSALIYHQSLQFTSSEDCVTDIDSKTSSSQVARVVRLGLCTVFELVRESRTSNPALCSRALHALLDSLQGQAPESLKNEPAEVTDPLFDLLLDLATAPCLVASPSDNSRQSVVSQLRSNACSALLSLVVALGHTGKMLSALSALLTTGHQVKEDLETPAILISVQRSVHAVMFGRKSKSDFKDDSKNDVGSETQILTHLSTGNFTGLPSIFSPEVALPSSPSTTISRSHAALNILSSLHVLTLGHQLGIIVQQDEKTKTQVLESLTKDDFSQINRFESHGGGWGYSGHSVEAVRFMVDADIVIGGFGVFGGRGEYVAKLRLYDIGVDGGDQETDGDVIAETDEVPYECGSRQSYPILFDEPIPVQANRWYVAWARIFGPSSDCGSSGLSLVSNLDDQITFYFKSSKKSNNGTDVNAGQIPVILYKLPSTQDNGPSSSNRNEEETEAAHILSRDYSMSVSVECFSSLIKLLKWAWQSFKTSVLELDVACVHSLDSLVAELKHLSFVCCVSLHLLRVYVNEVFPNVKRKQDYKMSKFDTSALAESVADVRSLVKTILLDSHWRQCDHLVSTNPESKKTTCALIEQVLNECQCTFVACYHAFYPSTPLQWRGLCDLLLSQPSDPNHGHESDELLTAMMAALCNPLIRLTLTFPLYQLLDYQTITSPSELASPTVNDTEYGQDAVLVEKLLERSDSEGCHGGIECNVRDVLVKIFTIIGQPLEYILYSSRSQSETLQELEDLKVAMGGLSPKLVEHGCALLSSLMSELVAQATGVGLDINTPVGQSLYVTPSRFSRVSQNHTWNTGNGSPDAICFLVDRAGISIAGVTVYGGQNSEWHHEVELLDYQGPMVEGAERLPGAEGVQGQQWMTVASAKGTYSLDDKSPEVAEIKFEKPFLIRENTKYAIRLKNHGSRTNNGDSGLPRIRGPDGTTFTFFDCSLSFNGTNHTRGQIPQLMYYSTPNCSRPQSSQLKKQDDSLSRRHVLDISDDVFSMSEDLLYQAQCLDSSDEVREISSSALVTLLLPSTIAHLVPIATSEAKSAVHVLSLVKRLLPLTSSLVKKLDMPELVSTSSPSPSCTSLVPKSVVTTSKLYVIVESEHPYKSASVSNYHVSFPSNIKWMSIEFDPRCGTAQPEDALQLFIPSTKLFGKGLEAPSAPSVKQDGVDLATGDYWPVFRKFTGSSGVGWPTKCVILPGNEVVFSLETATDYLKDEKASFYGFRCQLIGYEQPCDSSGGLPHLEQELSYLGATCINTLLNQNLYLPILSEESSCDEQDALKVFASHSDVLGKGLSITHLPSATEALEGILALSQDKPFLRDFVNCTPGTSGGRLASWLQPESYADLNKFEVVCTSSSEDGFRCGWPAVITVITKDQYGEVVYVPNLRVEVFAQPFHTNASNGSLTACSFEGKSVSQSENDEENKILFGGHAPPPITPYSVTVRDKMQYHAITMMSSFENYSFEELRFVSPVKRKTLEAMLVRVNEDGTCIANWTPCSAGWYQVKVLIDGVPISASQSVQVAESPKSVGMPNSFTEDKPTKWTDIVKPIKMKKFMGHQSAGLRVRSLPSLQSEQIGQIEPSTTITVLDELQNDDGIWVRLSSESVIKNCNLLPNYDSAAEAWCLQYNQHTGKNILLPVIESVSEPSSSKSNGSIEHFIVEPIQSVKAKNGFGNMLYTYPSTLHVIRCGNSGHNVRSKPTMRAPPVGMLVLGNTVVVSQEVRNSDGLWFKLGDESKRRYCFNTDADAWTLGSVDRGIVFLQHESEIMAVVSDESDNEAKIISRFKSKNLASKDWPMQSNEFPVSLKELPSQSLCQSFADSENASICSSASGCVTSATNAEHEKAETDQSSVSSTSSSKVTAYKKLFSDSLAGPSNVSQSKKEVSSSLGVNVKEMVRSISRESTPTPPGTPPTSITPKTNRSVSPTSSQPRRPSVPAKSWSVKELAKNRTANSNDVSSSSKQSTDQPAKHVNHSTQTSPPAEVEATSSSMTLQCSMMSLEYSYPSEQSVTITSPSKKRKPVTRKREILRSPKEPVEEVKLNISRQTSNQILAREAMSNSVAECLRAVFAAFIWHEGISNDAVTAASFLKFSGNLSKDAIYKSLGSDKSGQAEKQKNLVKERKARYRHSVEVSQLKTMNACYVNSNIDMNEKGADADKVDSDSENRNDVIKDLEELAKCSESEGDDLASEQPNIPETLIHLLYLWEQVSKVCILAVNNPALYGINSTSLVNESPTTPVQIFSRVVPEKLAQVAESEDNSPNSNVQLPVHGTVSQIPLNSNQRLNRIQSSKAFYIGQLQNLMRMRGNDDMSRRLPAFQAGKGRGSINNAVNMFGEASSANGHPKVVDPAQDRKDNTECELCGSSFPYPVTKHMRRAHPGCGEHAGGNGYNSSGSFCGGWAGHCGDGGVGTSNWYLICDRCREKYMSSKSVRDKDKIKNRLGLSGVQRSSASLASKIGTPTSCPNIHQVMKENALFLLRLVSANEQRSTLVGQSRSEFEMTNQSFECLEALGIHNVYKQKLAEANLTEEEIKAIQNGHLDETNYDEPTASSSANQRPEFARSLSVVASDQVANRNQMTPRKRATSSDSSGPLICQPSPALVNLIELVERNNLITTTVASNVPMYSRQLSQESSSRPPSSVHASKEVPQQDCFPANRPVLMFISQHHNLAQLHLAMKNTIKKTACRTHALQALTWLLRNVTQPTGLHDLMWSFVTSLNGQDKASGSSEPVVEKKELEADPVYHLQGGVCSHPSSDLVLAGESLKPLRDAFHGLLQTVSDLMPLLPMASPLQQIAVRCFHLNFEQLDHAFLHRSHVFSNISKILSRTDGEDQLNEELLGPCSPLRVQQIRIECLSDVTQQYEVKVSSRQAMIASLTDNSTETFWESGDEDRNKTKVVTLSCSDVDGDVSPRVIYVHIDNCRDLGSKVSRVCFKIVEISPADASSSTKIKTTNIDSRYAGWLSCRLPEQRIRTFKIELKGPDNSLRIRQVKVLGQDNSKVSNMKTPNYSQIQQMNCEAETLRVFRLLTSQVFGKLIAIADNDVFDNRLEPSPSSQELDNISANEDSNDLREHMVGILFSRSSKLSHLQKQVCSHIVQAIRVESVRLREEWECRLCSKNSVLHSNKEMPSDAYCFEMLSMVLALSGSAIGRQYLAQKDDLLSDLFSLLHTGSARVQRQVISLLRRVLPEILPISLIKIFDAKKLPPADFIALTNKETPLDVQETGVLDVFLACVAKSLTVQTKVKGSSAAGGSKNLNTITLATAIHPRDDLASRWWLRGCMARKMAEAIMVLVRDMASGKLGDGWATVTKNAIAENIINLTKLPDHLRVPADCLKTPTLWLALSSLCVLDQNHAEKLSSSHWVASAAGDQANGNQPQQHAKPFCDNHDDGDTLAIILCTVCGNLCAECDRFLHLHRKTRAHQRQIFKEEEEAIKVDLHEGCGRTKLFWLMALADSKTLKAMVEFRGENNRSKLASVVSNAQSQSAMATGTCRFCGVSGNHGPLAVGNVCGEAECQEHAANACQKTLPCGHLCGGVKDESHCLACLHGCSSSQLKQDADDMCMICFTEAISAAPALQLKCGHVFHLHCCMAVLNKQWPGPRITFTFSMCPICKTPVDHCVLDSMLQPVRSLFEDVKRKAVMRLEYEGLHRSEVITTPGARFYNDPAGYAMERYAYYVCCKCDKAYYGGEARCDAEAGLGEDYDPNELVCGACSDVSRAQMCPKHGTDFLEYKCRYCCSVAVFFCFGTTHFCNACHDDFQRVTNIAKQDLPKCPAGPRARQLDSQDCPLHVKHPATGEEFALGCGVCRNAHTF
ncbi:E3 ubiquitin-protein ligase MYCBP2 [Halotydeus destructor]|nr:E3 ubiquitin-protein ligase MYCBP2 [Halotydeus destructor]